jgi:hypothetical protein
MASRLPRPLPFLLPSFYTSEATSGSILVPDPKKSPRGKRAVAEQQAEAPLVIQALQEPLLEALQETDAQAPVKNEDLHWTPFVLVVVYHFIAGIESGRCLLTHLQHADPLWVYLPT